MGLLREKHTNRVRSFWTVNEWILHRIKEVVLLLGPSRRVRVPIVLAEARFSIICRPYNLGRPDLPTVLTNYTSELTTPYTNSWEMQLDREEEKQQKKPENLPTESALTILDKTATKDAMPNWLQQFNIRSLTPFYALRH